MSSTPVTQGSQPFVEPVLYFNTNGTVQWKGRTYDVKVGNIKVDTKEGLLALKSLLEAAFDKVKYEDVPFAKANITENHIVTYKHSNDNNPKTYTFTDKAVYNTALQSFQAMHPQQPPVANQPPPPPPAIHTAAPVNHDITIALTRVSQDPVLENLKIKARDASNKIRDLLITHDHKRMENANAATSLSDLENQDRALQIAANKDLKDSYEEYEKALAALGKAFSDASSQDKLKYQQAIQDVNSHHLQSHFSTSTVSIDHYRCSLHVAAKFRLLELKSELEELKLDLKKNSREIKSVEKRIKLIEEHSKKTPTARKAELLSIDEAKKEYQKCNDMYLVEQKGWSPVKLVALDINGLNRALCLPGNWLNKREISLGISGDNAYVNVTEVSPVEIEGKYSPSGQRKRNPTTPPNFQKTETYILDEDGNKIESSVSVCYRCGVFASKKSAEKALEEMARAGKPIYDDSLLTPSSVPNFIHEDRKLLENHVAFSNEVATDKRYELLQSNFGINVGATKGYKIEGLVMGWHSSLVDYNNPFVEKVNERLIEWFKDAERDLNKVKEAAAVYQLTLEMEAIWAKNDYARADVGDNPAKLPGTARVLMEKLGFTVNQHCKSCKDRGSVAEGYGTKVHLEMEMKRQNYRKFLENVQGAHQDFSEEEKEALTSGLFTEKEIIEIVTKSTVDHHDFLKARVKHKIDDIRQHLNLKENQRGPFDPKEIDVRPYSSHKLKMNLEGIEETTPKRDSDPSVVLNAGLMEPSIYDEKENLERANTIKANRRNAVLMGLAITKENTGVAGIKQEKGMIGALYSGFDRDYAMKVREEALNNQNFDHLYNILGLKELDNKLRVSFENRLKNPDEDIEALLKEIESAKEAVIRPLAEVSS